MPVHVPEAQSRFHRRGAREYPLSSAAGHQAARRRRGSLGRGDRCKAQAGEPWVPWGGEPSVRGRGSWWAGSWCDHETMSAKAACRSSIRTTSALSEEDAVGDDPVQTEMRSGWRHSSSVAAHNGSDPRLAGSQAEGAAPRSRQLRKRCHSREVDRRGVGERQEHEEPEPGRPGAEDASTSAAAVPVRQGEAASCTFAGAERGSDGVR